VPVPGILASTAPAAVTAAGGLIGFLVGIFGVGGSSVATPVLSLVGVPALAAVASPLPATIPGALLAAIPYVRSEDARPRAAAWSLLGAIPATVVGALLSEVVGGPALLIGSGLVLVLVGARVLLPIDDAARAAGTRRRQNRPLLVAAAFALGLFTGLLANGGGFLLMPLYLLVFGLRMREAVGTSLLVIGVLSVPTLVAHWALDHIDWAVSAEFALGLLPASIAGAWLAGRLPAGAQRRAFGVFLVVFGLAFTAYRLAS
jgi:uncharacterized membrane protein YfcA